MQQEVHYRRGITSNRKFGRKLVLGFQVSHKTLNFNKGEARVQQELRCWGRTHGCGEQQCNVCMLLPIRLHCKALLKIAGFKNHHKPSIPTVLQGRAFDFFLSGLRFFRKPEALDPTEHGERTFFFFLSGFCRSDSSLGPSTASTWRSSSACNSPTSAHFTAPRACTRS